jgi:signal transduction histidine kinase
VSTITAAAQLIARGDADPTLHALAERILSGSQRLRKMIADLLDASRLDARRLVLTREETDVGRLIRATIDGAAALVAGHPVKMQSPSDLPKVSIDPARIEQVLVNLLGNAARYGQKGGEIEVIAERVDNNVRISVLNEGAPISREELEGFFARFRRGGARRVAGSGLGLYISRGLIDAHGGRIWAEMDPSGRIAFRFTVPI